MGCAAVVKPALASDSVQKIHAQICDVHVDKNAMSIMQVDADHCEEYADQQMTEMGTISCMVAAVMRDDAPQSPDAVTSDWMEKATKEFGEKLSQDFYGTLEQVWTDESSRLRLFQELRQVKWPGKLSRWSPASVMAAWVASGLALVALLGVAWRRRSTCQSACRTSQSSMMSCNWRSEKLHFSCQRPWKPMMSWAFMLLLLLFVLAAAEDPSPLNHWPLPPLLGRIFRCGTRMDVFLSCLTRPLKSGKMVT